ncbi:MULTISPECIES: hypothetical protein [Nocardiaceae]|uniref:hypothetical protein n=1 Tax=Nocardiaceae TaxID=85025 RepID=UPI000B027493|nr:MULTISPECIES: hypothetical protein [Rhodococcus]
MKRKFRWRSVSGTWFTVEADVYEITFSGALAFGRVDGFLIIAIPARRWTECEELE